MGTNYYASTTFGECEACHRKGQRIHLGKTSAGWPPLLRLRDEPLEIHGFADLELFVLSPECEKIEDEYGRVYEPEAFLVRLEKHLQVNPEEPPYAGELGPQDDPYRILDRGFRGYPGEFS